MEKTPFRIFLGIAFLGLSFACLSWSAWDWGRREVTQVTAESEFEKLVEDRAGKSAKRVARKRVSGPVAKLEIARLGVSGIVEEGLDAKTLKNAIGMSLTSAQPGERGNVVLAAHRDTFFAGLRNAKKGDVVVLSTTDGKKHRYRISKTFVVDPSAHWVMNSSPKKKMLTLITCYPFRYVGSAPQRFIVQAEPVDDVKPKRPIRRG
jgi:LPXTG-site transpeptidase (sortase) family protein